MCVTKLQTIAGRRFAVQAHARDQAKSAQFGGQGLGTANCNANANLFLDFSIENAEMMENFPWKMMVLC